MQHPAMRGTTGRAVSAAIHSRLRDALAPGTPLTYAELAEQAGCTVRSVRNYLAHAQEIFGFEVEQQRTAGSHAVTVRAVIVTRAAQQPEPPPPAPQPPPAADLIGAVMHDRLLGRSLGSSAENPAPHHGLVLCAPGLPSYGSHQVPMFWRWIELSQMHPRRAVRLRLAMEPGEAVFWPVAGVVHLHDGLLLAAMPVAAEAASALQLVPLAHVQDDPDALQVLDAAETGEPPFDLTSIDVSKVTDTPSAALPNPLEPSTAVRVEARFKPGHALHLRSRQWHHTQNMVLRTDGSLDVTFGPVDLQAAASWAASFGRAIRVLGDKKLRKAVKKRLFMRPGVLG